MKKTQRIKIYLGTLLLTAAALGAACGGSSPAAVQTTRIKPTESPTPEYKPPKRVSRDVIKTTDDKPAPKEASLKVKGR